MAGSNPTRRDSDQDGIDDAVELANGSSPNDENSYPSWIDFAGAPDDQNADGLSDAWALWAGGKERVPAADDDGDGMSNAAESEAGTDPDDPSSLLKLTVRRTENDLLLEWQDLPFKRHSLTASRTLGSWQTDFSTQVREGGMRCITLANISASSLKRKFYQIKVLPLDSDNDGVEDWIEQTLLGSSPTVADSTRSPLTTTAQNTLSGDARTLLDYNTSGYSANPGATPPSPSPVHAARLLMQASFGPTPKSVEEVRTLGLRGWIDQQLALPATLHQAYIKEIKVDSKVGPFDNSYDFNKTISFPTAYNVTTPFARAAVGAPDQLRQRVAFALSQILVVSRRDNRLKEKLEGITNYYDMLIKHSFGNYEDLLLGVAKHPVMGVYLSHAGNQKAAPEIKRYPDENFAREIMQLFSIGLWELNQDGTRKLDSNGEPIPTYGNGEVTEMARVFTGLYFDSPNGFGGAGGK